MTVEYDIKRILERLEESSLDTYGVASQRVADGIRSSGLSSAMDSIRAQQREDLASIAIAIGTGTERVVEAILSNGKVLRSLEGAVRNPLSVAASERYRRGVEALQRGWIPESIKDLEVSVEQNPYDPMAHAALALARSADDDRVGAADQSLSAVRYAQGDSPEIEAACALLAIGLLEADGREDEARNVCTQALKRVPTNAELALAQARLSADEASLELAIRLAPGLAPVALAMNPRIAEKPIDLVSSDPRGPIGLAKQAVAVFRTIESTSHPDAVDAREKLGQSDPRDLVEAAAILESVADYQQRSRDLVTQSSWRLISEESARDNAERTRNSSSALIKNLEDEIANVTRKRTAAFTFGGLVIILATGLLGAGFAQTGAGGPMGSWSAPSTWLTILGVGGFFLGGWGISLAPKFRRLAELRSKLSAARLQIPGHVDAKYSMQTLHQLQAAVEALDEVAKRLPKRTRSFVIDTTTL